jgi:hypothetical protein
MEAEPLPVLNPSALQSADDITTGLCDADVSNGWRTYVFDAAVVAGTGAEIVEGSFATTQQDRHNRNMHFID